MTFPRERFLSLETNIAPHAPRVASCGAPPPSSQPAGPRARGCRQGDRRGGLRRGGREGEASAAGAVAQGRHRRDNHGRFRKHCGRDMPVASLSAHAQTRHTLCTVFGSLALLVEERHSGNHLSRLDEGGAGATTAFAPIREWSPRIAPNFLTPVASNSVPIRILICLSLTHFDDWR
jgi:hypothetical protein